MFGVFAVGHSLSFCGHRSKWVCEASAGAAGACTSVADGPTVSVGDAVPSRTASPCSTLVAPLETQSQTSPLLQEYPRVSGVHSVLHSSYCG